jgi:hypothetical protein
LQRNQPPGENAQIRWNLGLVDHPSTIVRSQPASSLSGTGAACAILRLASCYDRRVTGERGWVLRGRSVVARRASKGCRCPAGAWRRVRLP